MNVMLTCWFIVAYGFCWVQGYDTVCIATSLGLDAVGLDISSTAVKAANE